MVRQEKLFRLKPISDIVQALQKELLKPRVDWEAVDRGEKVLDRRTGILIQKIGSSNEGEDK